jgi:Ca-activated chloride channel family protein
MVLHNPHVRRGSRFSFCLITTIGLLLWSSVVTAQETQPDDVVRVSTDLLLFPVRIRDKRGLVPGLSERDLSLKDDDHVITGLYFSPGADRVALLFVLDQSGSLREIISQQRDAALALFARFGERSSVGILRFAEAPSLVVPFSRDTAAARDAFTFSAGRNQRTAIFDAAAAAVKSFDNLPRVRAERRIVVVISDGLDNASAIKPGTVIEMSREKRVSFYVVHLPLFAPADGRLAVRPPSKGFRDLAEKTGGKYFLVGDANSALRPAARSDLSQIFQAIEEDLKSQYLLGFYLSEAANDGRRHRFSLTLPDGLQYQVGSRGYSRKQDFFVHRPREALKPPD